MEFEFTREQQDFRQEVREFCLEAPRSELDREIDPHYSPSFYQKVAEKGWIGLHIPKEYGGQGKDSVYATIFAEEMAYNFAPLGPIYLAIELTHLLLECGTEHQKKEYLPRIINNEVMAAQAFTEPEAGSDLASVRTSAVRNGDYYIVNGQKMFCTHIHIPNAYSMLMARTDPSAPLEKGISLFMLDNRTPGISYTNIKTVSGLQTHQVFLDNVKIPREYLIGEENRGWDYFMKIKAYYWHKGRAGQLGVLRRMFDDLLKYVKKAQSNGHPLGQNPAVRRKVAEMAIDLKLLRLLTYRLAWMQSERLDASDFSAILKVAGDDIFIRFFNKAMQILGLSGQLGRHSSYAPLSGRFEAQYLGTSLYHFFDGGGASTAKNFLAAHGLGLPEF